MTDKARELLERALESLCWYEYKDLIDEISAYLAQPEVKREALSDEEIIEDIKGYYPPTVCSLSFELGVRFAEKHHGIGDNNENPNT